MRRTFIALAAAATIGVPTLYSGGAQAEPATTGTINGDGHTQALHTTRGVLAPTAPMLEIHWALNDDKNPPAPDGPTDPKPPTPSPSEPGEPDIPAPNPGPTTPPAPTPTPEDPPTPDDPNPGPTQPPAPGNPDPTPGNPDPTPGPGVPTPDDPAKPSPGPTTPNPGPTAPNPGPTTPPAPGANPTNPPAPTPGHTPSKPGPRYKASDRGTPPLPAGQVPSGLPPAPNGIGDVSTLVGGAPGPEAAQAPAPNVNTQRPSASELAQTGASSSALTSAAFGATGLALIAMRRRARKRSRA